MMTDNNPYGINETYMAIACWAYHENGDVPLNESGELWRGKFIAGDDQYEIVFNVTNSPHWDVYRTENINPFEVLVYSVEDSPVSRVEDSPVSSYAGPIFGSTPFSSRFEPVDATSRFEQAIRAAAKADLDELKQEDTDDETAVR
jgi:hypothetical protein